MEEIVLHVSVPSTCQVGSKINVMYEGKYYEVVVPPNGPGNTIQVSITLPDESTPVEVSSTPQVQSKPMVSSDPTVVAAAAVTGAVVGSLILGPLLTGAVIIGGAAVYVNSRNKKGQTNPSDDSNSANKPDMMTQMTTMGHQALGSATRAVNTGIVKAREVDEKYQISVKTNEFIHTTGEKIKTFDEEHKISERTTAAAQQAAVKAKEIDVKYNISGNINKAFSYGANVFTKMTTPSTTASANGTTATPVATAVPVYREDISSPNS